MSIHSKESFRKIAIVGGGQIGTSVALAAKARFPDAEIVVLDTAKNIKKDFLAAFEKAELPQNGITFSTNATDVEGADIVVLATPISQFGKAVKKIASFVTPNTLFTDVGSVKKLSMRRIRHALDRYVSPETPYVPFHILNGNAGSGPLTGAKNVLSAPGVIVPDQAPATAEESVTSFWDGLGSTLFKMSAQEHDCLFGTMSHLEHVMMFSFMKTDFMQKAASKGGYVDPGKWLASMARIANAGPEMWVGIFGDNRQQIFDSARMIRQRLASIAERLEDGSPSLLDDINDAHAFAKDKVGSRINQPFDISTVDGKDLRLTAFAGILSLAITQNAKQVQEQTGQELKPIANPSFLDGLGPMAVDPQNVAALARAYREELVPMIRDYLSHFDELVAGIHWRNRFSLDRTVKDVAQRHQKSFPKIFEPRSPRATLFRAASAKSG